MCNFHALEVVDRGKINSTFLVRERLYTSQSDVRRRQILTSKVGLRTERIKIIIMAVDP